MTRRHRPAARLGLLLAPLTALTLLGSVASAQTPIERRNNRYSPAQDVQLGREAAAEIRQKLPMLDDRQTEDFVEAIGERLIAQIPGDYRQPEFRYSFDVVNMKEINAFALPGGPMFVHRGMIEAARTEAEVAGVMAHELAHVVLRHGTAQATEGQKFQLGALAGQVIGSIVGGGWGAAIAQGSELGLGAYFMKYSREYEREADLFGAQVMARAGYDPRQMASMFQTIQKQGGSRGPEWLSSHPNPSNRVEAINREAESLRVQGNAGSGELPEIHARLDRLPPAPSAQQVARSESRQPRGRPTGTSGRAARVEPPSGRWRTHQPGDFLQVSVPENWRPMEAGGAIRYAPEGGTFQADGQLVFTHGIEVGLSQPGGGSLEDQTERLIQGFARANPQLRPQGRASRTTIAGRRGLTTTLSNVSDVTGEREAVNVSTVQLGDGSLLFLVGVAPADEARTYLNAFGRVRQSLRIDDRAR